MKPHVHSSCEHFLLVSIKSIKKVTCHISHMLQNTKIAYAGLQSGHDIDGMNVAAPDK